MRLSWSAKVAGAVMIPVALLLTGTALAVVRGASDLHRFRIVASAMEPTLHCMRGSGQGCEGDVDDVVLTRSFRPGDARRAAILLFHAPPKAHLMCGTTASALFVKRLIGLPGETVSEKRGGWIYINGRKLSEPYIKPDRRDSNVGTWHVSRGKYFFMGDNRGSSCDSRVWGSVPKRNLLWTVVSIDRGGTIIPVP